MSDITDRLNAANALIKVIGSTGRRFLYSAHTDEYGKLLVNENGEVIYHDHYTRSLMVVKSGAKMKGFSNGGTMRELVVLMAEYVETGKQIPMGYIGLERHDGSFIWGIDKDTVMAIRDKAAATGVMLEEEA